MQNNIYDILKNFNKVANQDQPSTAKPAEAKTQLQESMEQVLEKRYLEEKKASKVKNPYAVGMAAAKKAAGITKTPAHDLPKKVIKKGHEIAKKIDEDESCTCEETNESECPMHGDKLDEEGTRKVKGKAYGGSAQADDDADDADDADTSKAAEKEAPRKRGRPPKGTPKKVVAKKVPGKRGRPMGSVKKPADPSKKYSVPANFGTMFNPKMAPSMTGIKSRKHKMIGESVEMEGMTMGDLPPSMRKPVSLQTMNEPAVKTALPKLSSAEELGKSAPGMNPPVHKAFDEDDEELNELARLAGLPNKHGMAEDEMEEGNDFTKARLDAIKAGKSHFTVDGKSYKVTGDTSDERAQVDESALAECGMMGGYGMQQSQQDNLNITTNYNSASGNKSITISAEGNKADELLQMLKLAGMDSSAAEHEPEAVIVSAGEEDADEEEVDEDSRYHANTTPDEHVYDTEALTTGGDGEVAGKQKTMHNDKPTWKNADNALAESQALKFIQEYESILKRQGVTEAAKKDKCICTSKKHDPKCPMHKK